MGILPRSSYYDHHNRQAAALMRARQPYLIKNIITGVGLFSFTIGIYYMTFKLVGQDDFDDVKPPALPAQSNKPSQPAHAPNSST